MKEFPAVMLRRNGSKVIVLMCFMLLIGVVAAQQPKNLSRTEMEETKETPMAGINRHFEEMLSEHEIKNMNSNNELTAGISKHLMDVLEEKSKEARNNAKVEKHSIERVTSSTKVHENVEKVEETENTNNAEIEEIEETEEVEETKTEILYKSIEEVKISRDMNLTETTGLSREDFCELLANFQNDYAGFYERNAGLIWDLSQEYQVNEIFLCGVFALESYYGSNKSHMDAHNYGSMMNGHGKLISYESDAEGIEANYKLFANSYLSSEGKYYKGVTLDSVGDTYCPPTKDCPSWAGKVYCCMQYFLE